MKFRYLPKRKHFALFAVLNSLSGFSIGLFTPIFAIFIKQIGGGLLEMGLAYSILMAQTGILMLFSGSVADKFGIKKIYMAGSFLYSITLFFYIFVGQVYQIFILEFLKGIANGITIPLWSIISVRLADGTRIGREVGFMQAGFWIAQGIAGVVGASIAYFFSFQILFLFVGVTSLLGSLIIIPLKIE